MHFLNLWLTSIPFHWCHFHPYIRLHFNYFFLLELIRYSLDFLVVTVLSMKVPPAPFTHQVWQFLLSGCPLVEVLVTQVHPNTKAIGKYLCHYSYLHCYTYLIRGVGDKQVHPVVFVASKSSVFSGSSCISAPGKTFKTMVPALNWWVDRSSAAARYIVQWGWLCFARVGWKLQKSIAISGNFPKENP